MNPSQAVERSFLGGALLSNSSANRRVQATWKTAPRGFRNA
jgi:hypothetical protein